ncbi:unnamed protein product [Clonostachys chloroleuca]|uniref:Uncharacterized protein n=1 Tax=Clonostachys chloroleuca TaxID=1926264 RepID=A0AA35MA63_9HYPO|nr:unnamed protein product [Clonostachys chloroleuca]
MFRQMNDDAEMTTESASFSAEFFGPDILETYEWPVLAESMDSSSPVDLSPLEDFIAQENAKCLLDTTENPSACEPAVFQDSMEAHDSDAACHSEVAITQEDINYLFDVTKPQAACETAVSQDLADAHDQVPSSHSQVFTQQGPEEIDAVVGGTEPESHFDLALSQDAVVGHDSVPSSHSPVLTQERMVENENLFGSPEPESQDPAEAAGAVPPSTAQSENAGSGNKITAPSKEKPAFPLALPQPQPSPPSASATTQSAKAYSSKKDKFHRLVLPQPAPASSSTPQNGNIATAAPKSQAKPAVTLALPQPPADSSDTTQNVSTTSASSKNNAKSQPQPSSAVPSSTTQRRKAAPKKKSTAATTQSLLQAQPDVQGKPPAQIDLTSSDTHQTGNGTAVSNPQTGSFQAVMPQMSTATGMNNASRSVPKSYGNGHFPTSCDTSSEFCEDHEMENNAAVVKPHASNPGPVTTSGLPPQAFVGSSLSSLPGQAPVGVSSAQMPQFANGVGYPFMMPGQFPIMGMGPGQQPNFMGMPHPAHLANNFMADQLNMNPAATGGAFSGFQAPMAYPNNGVPSMAPQQGFHPVQNGQTSTNATVFQGVPPSTTLPAETGSTEASNAKATKTTKASKAAPAKAQKAQAPKPRKAPAKKAAPVQPSPVQNVPAVTQEATSTSSTGMAAWKSQLPAPNPWQPLNPDQIMIITGVHPLHLPADMEFVSKLPEVPGSAVRHNDMTNLTAQERELVIHTAARNIFYAGVEAGVERAIQQMVNDMDSSGEALGLAPADLPPQGPFRTKFLDTLETKMKKAAKKWAALTYEEADHLIKPVQAL